jgi:hypothetical protein
VLFSTDHREPERISLVGVGTNPNTDNLLFARRELVRMGASVIGVVSGERGGSLISGEVVASGSRQQTVLDVLHLGF